MYYLVNDENFLKKYLFGSKSIIIFLSLRPLPRFYFIYLVCTMLSFIDESLQKISTK